VSIRAILVVLAALACGASAAIGMSSFLRDSTLAVEIKTEPLVVATIDIPRGHTIKAEEVQVQQWPQGMLPQGVVAKVSDVVDRATLVPIVAGEPMLNPKLAAKDAGRGLAALVPKGMRAYTIQAARAASNVAGFILPGNRVDVLLNLRGNPTDDSGGGSTTTLLQSVEILAVDQQLDAPADNKTNPRDLGSVTLLVTPSQAALLDLGQNLGQLTLSLRNLEDRDEAVTRPATLADIRYRQEKPIEERKVAKPILPDPALAEKPVDPSGIVTLRGTQRGFVSITHGR
jgi:pilus assembly protein CpaB